jgi:hypothetical protein
MRTSRAVPVLFALGSLLALAPAARAGEEIFPWNFDGGSYSGWSDVESSQVPKLGQLVITEVMANPLGTEADKEWFELFNLTSFQLNFDGCAVDGGTQIAVQALVNATQIAVLARSANTSVNGGIAPRAAAEFSFSNTSDTLTLACFGTTVDVVTWTTTVDGQSWALDPPALNIVLNDDPMNWCFDSSHAYGDTSAGTGTPGIFNSACP